MKNKVGAIEVLAMVALLILPLATSASGERPYVAIVGNDSAADSFYFSPKHMEFLYDQSATGIAKAAPVCYGSSFPPVNQYTRVGGPSAGCEQFRSQTLNNQAEICDTTGTGTPPNFSDRGLRSARTTAGNAGFYEWFIRVPQAPSGQLNIVIECGVLTPGAFTVDKYGSIELCADETGERVGAGTCVSQLVYPGVNPVNPTALPRLTAVAYPGPHAPSNWPAFHLTAFKNPSSYTLDTDSTGIDMLNSYNLQVLDGTTNARVLLKACMNETVVAKLPVSGQMNAAGEAEQNLAQGDLIYVRLDVPRQNTVDVYCHAQSVKVAGVGNGF